MILHPRLTSVIMRLQPCCSVQRRRKSHLLCGSRSRRRVLLESFLLCRSPVGLMLPAFSPCKQHPALTSDVLAGHATRLTPAPFPCDSHRAASPWKPLSWSSNANPGFWTIPRCPTTLGSSCACSTLIFPPCSPNQGRFEQLWSERRASSPDLPLMAASSHSSSHERPAGTTFPRRSHIWRPVWRLQLASTSWCWVQHSSNAQLWQLPGHACWQLE